MKEAQKRLDEEQLKGQETVERTEILEYIAFSYYSLEDMKRALHYTNELLGMHDMTVLHVRRTLFVHILYSQKIENGGRE